MSWDVHADLAQIAKRLPSFSVRPWSIRMMRVLMRMTALRQNIEGVDVSVREADGARVRVLSPRGSAPTGALLWIHGGGLVIGDPSMDDGRCAELVRELGIVVVSAYYRLAPKHPFPAAVDDCRAAWGWLQSNLQELGIDSSRVGVGGESAGGGIAASLAQRLHDEGGLQPACQLLVYPMLDDRTAARRELDSPQHMVWTNRSNLTGWSSYLGSAPGGASVPEYAVPARREDLSGLPPAWIGVGNLDLFLEEDREYARRLNEAGVPCRLDEFPGAFHGFLVVAPDAPISRAGLEAQLVFLREHLLQVSPRP